MARTKKKKPKKPGWKTVKIPQWAYESALLAKGDALTGALKPCFPVLDPMVCPRCHGDLQPFSLDISVRTKTIARRACGYAQPRFGPDDKIGGGVGVILGLGLNALFAFNARHLPKKGKR